MDNMHKFRDTLVALREELYNRVTEDRRRRLYEAVETAETLDVADAEDSVYDADPLDVFLFDVVETLTHEYEVSEDDATDVMMAVMDALIEGGVIEEMPADDMDALAEWTAALMNIGFVDLIREYIRSELESE